MYECAYIIKYIYIYLYIRKCTFILYLHEKQYICNYKNNLFTLVIETNSS